MQRQIVIGLIVVLGQALSAQDTKTTSPARELFYSVLVKKDPVPTRKIAAKTTKASASNTGKSDSAPVPSASAEAGARHLGLRYNLVLVDQASGRAEQVDSDRVFHEGECFAIDFLSNRAGYLYVFAKQSSGSWQLFLPSPQMASESNIIQPDKEIRVPARYCFEIHNPPGTETLFVALTRDPSDVGALYEQIKGGTAAPPPAAEPSRPAQAAPVQLADARLTNDAIERMRQQFGTRDIAIRKVNQPLSQDEPAGAVYVVNVSNTPTSSVVTQIEVRHR